MKLQLVIASLILSLHAFALNIQDIELNVPGGWLLKQTANSTKGKIFGFSNQTEQFTIFVAKSAPVDTSFSDIENRLKSTNEQYGNFAWTTLETSGNSQNTNRAYGKAFLRRMRDHVYFGYASAASASRAKQIVQDFLQSVKLPHRSLTDEYYYGKKYYFGFGDTLSGFMGNEVKYDVAHTHDIFTQSQGGDYSGHKYISSSGGSTIREQWQSYKNKMTSHDMYVQYSSGHGSHSELMIGVRYDEIRDAVLSFPAKELIVFTMSCYSGNLVDSFNKKKSVWENWGQYGRTLMVMASSKSWEESSTGPGTDSDESGGPSGSAGSAFGHALWKALIGYSDGFGDGIKDGFLSLGEIRDFSIWKTKRVGGHTPVVTGVYNDGLVMAEVPSKEFIASLGPNTEGLSEKEITRKIQELDHAMRVR